MLKWVLVLLSLIQLSSSAGPYNYKADWASLDSRPNPPWYSRAKFGIMLHWGVYSVPTFGDEWFMRKAYRDKEPDYVNYLKQNFKPGHTYQDFARDFTAENYNATEWVELFKDSGAKYVILTSKHHDGYALWNASRTFSWNSVDVGPHRDLVHELSEAMKKSDLTFGLYNSLMEWFNPLYLADKAKNYTTDEFARSKAIPELKELVNRFKPQYLWMDGDCEAPDAYWKSKEFLVWLFNESPVRDTVLVNDRWGAGIKGKHGSVYTVHDRYNPGVLQAHVFENAMRLDNRSWGFRPDAPLKDYFDTPYLIEQLVTTVSCGGNLLLNVGPTKDGRITPHFEERLREMGAWLKVNGEAIYDTTPWVHQRDIFESNVW